MLYFAAQILGRLTQNAFCSFSGIFRPLKTKKEVILTLWNCCNSALFQLFKFQQFGRKKLSFSAILSWCCCLFLPLICSFYLGFNRMTLTSLSLGVKESRLGEENAKGRVRLDSNKRVHANSKTRKKGLVRWF